LVKSFLRSYCVSIINLQASLSPFNANVFAVLKYDFYLRDFYVEDSIADLRGDEIYSGFN
jgi:hypothetical protein